MERRGLLLSGVGAGSRKWLAILLSAGVFGVFHFLLDKFAVTAAMGVVLGLLCWQSRSILPGMIAHGLHNAIGACTIVWPELQQRMGLPADGIDPDLWPHLSTRPLLLGIGVFVVGLWITLRSSPSLSASPPAASPDPA